MGNKFVLPLALRYIEVLFHIFYYHRTSTNGHSLKWPFFFVPADRPYNDIYIDICLHLSTTATGTKARP